MTVSPQVKSKKRSKPNKAECACCLAIFYLCYIETLLIGPILAACPSPNAIRSIFVWYIYIYILTAKIN